jgi:hypothetical protein
LFCRKFMVACEAKEHGHDSKQRHQVEWPIMKAKEWMREFGRSYKCTLVLFFGRQATPPTLCFCARSFSPDLWQPAQENIILLPKPIHFGH